MGENTELTDFIGSIQPTLEGARGVILNRSGTREYLRVGERVTVPGHNRINVDEVISAVVCSSCGEGVIVRGSEGEHTGSGSVHEYTYGPGGHCPQCGEWCEAWVMFTVDGVNLRLANLRAQSNCTIAQIANIDRFKGLH